MKRIIFTVLFLLCISSVSFAKDQYIGDEWGVHDEVKREKSKDVYYERQRMYREMLKTQDLESEINYRKKVRELNLRKKEKEYDIQNNNSRKNNR